MKGKARWRTHGFCCVTLLLFLLGNTVSAQTIYRCEGEQGEPRFEQRPCGQTYQKIELKDHFNSLPKQLGAYPAKTEKGSPTSKTAKGSTTPARSMTSLSSRKSVPGTRQAKQTCMKYQHKLALLDQKLSKALRPRERERLELDAEWTARHMEMVCAEAMP